MAKPLAKEDVIKGLKSGKYKMIKHVAKSNATPDPIWNTFRAIATVQEANKPSVKIPGFVACVLCKGNYVCAWKSGGYKTQKNHMKQVHNTDKKQPKISNKLYKEFSHLHIKRIRQACQKFVLLDLRPFASVKGEGFIHLCHELVSIGADLGGQVTKQHVKQTLPHPTTISRGVVAKEKELRTLLKQRVQGSLDEYPTPISLTFDGWTDKIRSRQWLGVTLHFWSDDYSNVRCVYLACKEWNNCITQEKLADESIVEDSQVPSSFDQPIDVGIHVDVDAVSSDEDESVAEEKNQSAESVSLVDTAETGENIKTAVKFILDENGLSQLFDNPKIWMSTDCGSNVTKAVRLIRNGHIKCINHRLNTALQHAIKECVDQSKKFAKGIRRLKRLVTKVKQSHRVQIFDPTLKQWVETRWTTLYNLFHSVHQNYEKCVKYCIDKGYKNLITISKINLKQLCDLLLIIKQTHETFQKRTLPTIHRVIPQLVVLLKVACKINDNKDDPNKDGFYVKKLKSELRSAIEDTAVKSIQTVHWKAVLLNPQSRAKKFKTIPAEYNFRNIAIAQLKSEIEAMSAADICPNFPSPPRKKFKGKVKNNVAHEQDLYDESESDEDSDFDAVEPEPQTDWDRYVRMNMKNEPMKQYTHNPMLFWKKHEGTMSYLFKISRSIFIIQSSASPSESMFSFAGNVLPAKRNQLKAENLSGQTFCASYMKLQITEQKEKQNDMNQTPSK